MTRQQFITLVEETRGAFRGFLNALCCGDTSTADDIAQEAYLKAYMTCDKLQEPEKFKSWIFRIGYTTFIDGKRKIRPCVEYNDAVDVIDDSVPAEHREQQVTALYAALNRLSPAERTALALFYLQDYSIKEIARIVKAGESAVKQHLSRGRRHLREILPPDILTP